MSDTVTDPDDETLDPPDGQSGGGGIEANPDLDPIITDPQALPLDPPEGQGGGG